jgi:dipeptidase
MTMNRDTFGGSKYDLSLGLAAGPWGTPTRYDGTTQFMEGVTFERLREGHFERAISLHRTIYSYVTQSRLVHLFFHSSLLMYIVGVVFDGR